MSIAIVIDTCVFISALRSRNGASFRLLSLADSAKFEFCLSVPLVLEYEAVAKRMSKQIGLRYSDIDDVIDYLCLVGTHHKVHFLWRPSLKDPGDDFVLELAVVSESRYIVTHNVRDFSVAEKFDIRAVTPQMFLQMTGESMSTISLRLPDSLHERVRELAKKDNISINQFVTTALAEKMSALVTEEYLQARAEKGDRKKFEHVLDKVRDIEPDDADKL